MCVLDAPGPNTLIGLGKGKADKAALVKKLVPHYKALLEKLKSLGVSEVQLHEPILVTPGANKYQVHCSAISCCSPSCQPMFADLLLTRELPSCYARNLKHVYTVLAMSL